MERNSLKLLTIGQIAEKVGVNIQTIRFYERSGLLKPQSRSLGGYRLYGDESLKALWFIRQAKSLGFSLREIRGFLNLRISSVGACEQVQKKTKQKLEEVEVKITYLKSLEKVLKKLIRDCENRIVSDFCPIIEKLRE